MEATHLDRATADGLVAAPLTYPTAVGAQGGVPDGYASFIHTADLGSVDFTDTADALMSWQVQLRSGVQVAASSPTAQVGSVVVLRLGVGPLAVRAPCRVVRVVDEPTRKGFAYGTLPGHPESGEESFILCHDGEGRVTLTITAFSRPASQLARAAGPVSREQSNEGSRAATCVPWPPAEHLTMGGWWLPPASLRLGSATLLRVFGLEVGTDLSALDGCDLESIDLTLHQVQLRFDSARGFIVSIEADLAVTSPDGQAVLYDRVPAAAQPLADRLGVAVVRASGEAPGAVAIRFADGFLLEIFDSNERYESYQIHPGVRLIVV